MYGPAFESMYEGSLYGAGVTVFAVWGYAIAHAYSGKGLVELNARKLKDTLGGEQADVEAAIKFLCDADQHSRSKEEAGARLVQEGQFLYRVVNWEKYKALMSQTARRAYKAEWAKADRDLRSRDPEQISDQKKEEERERIRQRDGDTASTQGRQRKTSVDTRTGTRLPADWVPGPLTTNQLAEFGLTQSEADGHFPGFQDHWFASKQPNAVKRDWQAAWRSWLRSPYRTSKGPQRGAGGQQTPREKAQATAFRLYQEAKDKESA